MGARVKQERERLGKSQTDFGVAAGVGRQSQFNYESGKRIPDANYLAAIAALGADVLFIVCGEKSFEHVRALSPDEQLVIDYFRLASPDIRRSVIAVLLHANRDVMPSSPRTSQVFHGKVGTVVQGGVTGNMTVSHNTRKRKPKAEPDTE